MALYAAYIAELPGWHATHREHFGHDRWEDLRNALERVTWMQALPRPETAKMLTEDKFWDTNDRYLMLNTSIRKFIGQVYSYKHTML